MVRVIVSRSWVVYFVQTLFVVIIDRAHEHFAAEILHITGDSLTDNQSIKLDPPSSEFGYLYNKVRYSTRVTS